MTLKKFILITVSVLLASSAGLFYLLNSPIQESPIINNYINNSFQTSEYASSFSKFQNTEKHSALALITSHHFLAKDLIAQTFANINSSQIKTIIIISPDHFNQIDDASCLTQTTLNTSWKTPFGLVDSDQNFIRDISQKKSFCQNLNTFRGEHGIYTLTPFIKNYFPNAKIVPLVLKQNSDLAYYHNLGQEISKTVNLNETLLVVSSDFSHHATVDQAIKNDQKSIELLPHKKVEEISSITNDCQQCTAFLFGYLTNINTDFNLVSNQNSYDLSGEKNNNITSYVNAYFSQSKTLTTTITITGDVMLGRDVMTTSLSKNPSYPFEKTADILKKADITFVNLENPIIENCHQSDNQFILCANPKMIQGLTFAGIDIVNLANNHTKNYGHNGFVQTQNYLKNEKIDYVGAENLIIKNINQTKFGFLGFDFTTNKPKDSDYTLIKNSKEKVDVLIVMTHWGNEYTVAPTTAQKLTALNIINAGADVIVGGHPHWVQSMEYINNKPVFYSLGNFIFDQPWSEETKKGLVISLKYQNNKLIEIENMQTYMEKFSQPKWVKTTSTLLP